MILEVPQPWEHYRTLRDIETLVPSPGVVIFHGLGPDLRRVLRHEIMVLVS